MGAGLCLAAVAISGCSSTSAKAGHSTSTPPLGFRSQPSFLPTTTSPVDRVVTASPSQPQLAVQGVGVQVELPSGHVLATVTGPVVPPFVAPPPEQVTATFDIALRDVSGTIPIKLAEFTITDQLGRTFHPTLVRSEAAPPAIIATGHVLDLHVTAVMPTGEGRIYWSPTPGRAFVGWDFIVEND